MFLLILFPILILIFHPFACNVQARKKNAFILHSIYSLRCKNSAKFGCLLGCWCMHTHIHTISPSPPHCTWKEPHSSNMRSWFQFWDKCWTIGILNQMRHILIFYDFYDLLLLTPQGGRNVIKGCISTLQHAYILHRRINTKAVKRDM